MKAAALILAAALVASPGAAWPAFEAPAEDAASLGLAGAGPAWPLPGRPVADRPLVFGARPGPGFSLSSTRLEAAPELERQAIAAWFPARGALLTLRVRRLALGGYSETQALLEVCRPAAGPGWGWALAAGRESWRADSPGPAGEAGWRVDCALGFAPRHGLRLAGRLTQSGLAAGAPPGATLEVGVTADPARGWRAGIGSEAARNGFFGRIRVGVECRPAEGAVLRVGMLPSDGIVTVGLGVRRGIVALDVARRGDPLLGAATTLGFSVVAPSRERP
jgi:hypothetical protein